MVCSETIVIFALDTLQVHLDGLLRLPRMLITVRSLLVKIFGVVFSVLLVTEHIREEATLQGCIGLLTQLGSLRDKVSLTASQSCHHYLSKFVFFLF